MRICTARILAVLTPFVAPVRTFAETVSSPSDFKGLVDILIDIMGNLVLLVFALTFLAVVWGIVRGWIIHGGDAEGIESGKNTVLVGIIALVIMSSIWGILALLRASLFGG